MCDIAALTPIGVPQCARCGQPVALDPRPRRRSNQPPNQPQAQNGHEIEQRTTPGTVGVTCTKCGTSIPPNLKFCPSCGTKATIAAPQDFEGIQTRVGPRPGPGRGAEARAQHTVLRRCAAGGARQKYTLIRGDGEEDGVSFTLAGTDHLAGRGDVPISFPDDGSLSPIHANFRYFDNRLVVRDEAR